MLVETLAEMKKLLCKAFKQVAFIKSELLFQRGNLLFIFGVGLKGQNCDECKFWRN